MDVLAAALDRAPLPAHRTSATLAAAREDRRPRAFELQVATSPVAVGDLAEQDRASVAELRREATELMAGVGLRQWDRVRG